MYHVRVPKEHGGRPIEYLVLSAKSEGNEIAVPLAIKSKSGEMGSYSIYQRRGLVFEFQRTMRAAVVHYW